MSVSPDWSLRGVRPKCAPTSLERGNRPGSSTPEVKVMAISAPTPGTVVRRRQTASVRTVASMARCSLENSTRRAPRACRIAAATRSSIVCPLTSVRTRAANWPLARLADLQPEAAQEPAQAELHIAHLGLQLLARHQQRPYLLG